ncbi:MAG: hypothetical protein ACRCSU_08865 [Paracoccaceae bacterium]
MTNTPTKPPGSPARFMSDPDTPGLNTSAPINREALDVPATAAQNPTPVSNPATMMPDSPALPEIMYEGFEYRSQGRRPGSYFAFGVWLIMANLAWVYDAHPVFWGALAFFLVILGWWLVRNPISGMTITETHLSIFNGDVRWKIPLTDIDCIIRSVGKGGKPGYKLHFTDGKTDVLPVDVTPKSDVLAEEFHKRGIRIVDDTPEPMR